MSGASARAQVNAQRCPAGEAWDAPMAMCMPAAPATVNGPAPAPSNALSYDLMTSPDGCGSAGYYHFGMAMCLTKPVVAGRFYGMAMANIFFAFDSVQGPRGANQLVAPDWLMVDLGVDLARWNRLEADIMLTAERWLLPDSGYPLLLQIGENDEAGKPFIDAQHPHSSPIMGLTLTDVISFSATRTRLLRVFFAPRGESTDGPIAMMHRPTGTVNPDAPLGHHVGQDVGHITSTVIGASLYLGGTLVEASTFHGREPEPTRVDLPIAAPDSVALRVVRQFDRHFLGAASAAYVNDPEGESDIPHELRFSTSGYGQWDLPRGWRAHATLIWGGLTSYDRATFLESIAAEWLFVNAVHALWGRLEVLQRTPAELAVAGSAAPDTGRWVGALTAGYTHRIAGAAGIDFSVGGSATVSFVPGDFAAAYGGRAIASGKLFFEARMMQMFRAGPQTTNAMKPN